MEHKYLEQSLDLLHKKYGLDGMNEVILNRPDKLILFGDVSNPNEVELHLLVGSLMQLGFPDQSSIFLQTLFDKIDLNNSYAEVGGKDEYYSSIVAEILDFSTVTNITFPLLTTVRNWVRLTTVPTTTNSSIQAFHFTIVTEYIQTEEDVFYKTHHDSLTGLFNKYTLDYHYGLRYKNENFHAIYMDLDDFKVLNDTLGHQEGNKYLKAFGQILRGHETNFSRFYRIGGDEFVGLYFDTPENIKLLAAKIIQQTMDLTSDLHDIHTSVSIGIIQAVSRVDVIRKADRLMYLAKKKGKNQFLYEVEE